MKFLHWALLIVSCWLNSYKLSAQQNRLPGHFSGADWKSRISPGLISRDTAFFLSSNPQFFSIEIADPLSFIVFASGNREKLNILKQFGSHFLVVRCSPSFLRQMLIENRIINAEEALMRPSQEGGVISFDHTVNAIEAAHHFFPGVNGGGQLVSVKENSMDTTDMDISGRYRNTGVAATVGNTHATVMTTLIAGGGHSSYKGKGVAFKADYTSSDFTGVLPDADAIYRDNDIRVQNHSYGAAIQAWYGTNARAFDLSANSNPALLHVFSSGNSGAVIPADGTYAGISGYANLTGNMKMAKNALVVGAVDSLLQIPGASSRGPAFDGRVKPEIVAFAEDGTSGSAALVSGSAALLQQLYEEKSGMYAGSEMIKAILVNAADDVGSPGPDFVSGYGNLNLYRALLTVSDKRYVSGTLMPFSREEVIIRIPQNARNLKVTLAWNDPAAVAFSSKALVNDIDLTVENLSTGETWFPWVLNSYAHEDSLGKQAVRKRDTLNNIEQVGIEEVGGEYRVSVRSAVLRNVRQSFALAWQYDMPETFTWMAPNDGTKMEAGKNYFLRWDHSYPDGTIGELQWKRTTQSNWETISTLVLNKYFSWQVPELFGMAEFRMIIGNDTSHSGKFVISPLPEIRTGLICDSVLVYWSPSDPDVQWNVYRYNSDSMQLIGKVNDTSIVIGEQGSPYVAVAPVTEGREGLRSEAMNIEQQNVGCYINSFLADLVNEREGRLTLRLGAIYGIKKIRILKLGNNVTELATYSADITNSYTYTDVNLHPGLNRYRVEIERVAGGPVYSQVETILYNNGRPYILFPNPVRRGEPLNLLQESVNDLECLLFDATGRLLRKQVLTDKVAVIQTTDLSTGLYHLVIMDERKQTYRYKFIVR